MDPHMLITAALRGRGVAQEDYWGSPIASLDTEVLQSPCTDSCHLHTQVEKILILF